MIDSDGLYLAMQDALAEVKRQLAEAGLKPDNARLVVWCGWTGQEIEFDLTSGWSGAEIKVKGKNLQDVVDEFLRRHGFERQQRQLAIGHRTVPGAAAQGPGALVPGDDTMPL